MGICEAAATGARLVDAVLAALTDFFFEGAAMRAVGAALREDRADLACLALVDLRVPARAPAALRAVGLETRTAFLAAAVLRDAALRAAGFLVFETFFAGISFSAPG
jgi:hypothetical protein